MSTSPHPHPLTPALVRSNGQPRRTLSPEATAKAVTVPKKKPAMATLTIISRAFLATVPGTVLRTVPGAVLANVSGAILLATVSGTEKTPRTAEEKTAKTSVSIETATAAAATTSASATFAPAAVENAPCRPLRVLPPPPTLTAMARACLAPTTMTTKMTTKMGYSGWVMILIGERGASRSRPTARNGRRFWGQTCSGHRARNGGEIGSRVRQMNR